MEIFKHRADRDKWNAYSADVIPNWVWIVGAVAFTAAAAWSFAARNDNPVAASSVSLPTAIGLSTPARKHNGD